MSAIKYPFYFYPRHSQLHDCRYVTSPREEFKEYTSNALDQYPRLRSFIDNGKVKIERLHDQQITKRGIEYEAGSVQLKATLEEDKKKVNKVTKLLANLETSLDQLGKGLLSLATS